MHILYEDSHILVVWKPAGMESQESRGLGADMVSEIRKFIHSRSPGPEVPYVGVIHRLDRPVSGILVYARTKKAAASLSKQLAEQRMKKDYLAVLCGKPVDNVDKFVDYLLKDSRTNRSSIVDKGITGAKRAALSYEIVLGPDYPGDRTPPPDPGADGRPRTAAVGGPEVPSGREFLCRAESGPGCLEAVLCPPCDR